MASLPRLLLSAVLAVGVTMGLFYFMYYLVAGQDTNIGRHHEPVNIVFRQQIFEDQLKTRDRRIPEEPPPPEKMPPKPEMNVEKVDRQLSPMPNLNVTSFDVPYSGSGVYLGGISDIGGGMAQSGQLIPLVRIQPQYPRRAALAGLEGFVIVEFTITPAGTVTDVSVLESQPPRVFDRSAIRAILKWKFKPKVVDGRPVPMRATLQLDFNLDNMG